MPTTWVSPMPRAVRTERVGIPDLTVYSEGSPSVFVTGATGFIGRGLVAALLDRGYAVSALVLPAELDTVPGGVRAYPGDVADPHTVCQAIADARPQQVYHLAAVGLTNPGLPMADALRVNVGGLINVLEGARATGGVQRLVLAGSSYEYGARRADDDLDPFNAYSASKAAGWAFARAAHNAWDTPVVWVRPFQVYGPGQPPQALIPAAIRAALADRDFPTTRGEQQRDFVYVADVVKGLVAAGHAPAIEGRVLDLGTGTLTSVRQVIDRIWALTGSRGRILAGALPYRPGEVPAIPASIGRTRLLTGWEATRSLDEGLQLTIATLRDGDGRASGDAVARVPVRLLEGEYVD